MENLNGASVPKKTFEPAPIILLSREAVELHLKLLVGEGGNFLKSKPDPISIYRTRSLRWLSQIVVQIIKKVGWETEFTCVGITSLAQFSAKIEALEALDPISSAINSPRSDGSSSSEPIRRFDYIQFSQKTDAMIELLTATADGLAAMWDQGASVSEKMNTSTQVSGRPFSSNAYLPLVRFFFTIARNLSVESQSLGENTDGIAVSKDLNTGAAFILWFSLKAQEIKCLPQKQYALVVRCGVRNKVSSAVKKHRRPTFNYYSFSWPTATSLSTRSLKPLWLVKTSILEKWPLT